MNDVSFVKTYLLDMFSRSHYGLSVADIHLVLTTHGDDSRDLYNEWNDIRYKTMSCSEHTLAHNCILGSFIGFCTTSTRFQYFQKYYESIGELDFYNNVMIGYIDGLYNEISTLPQIL